MQCHILMALSLHVQLFSWNDEFPDVNMSGTLFWSVIRHIEYTFEALGRNKQHKTDSSYPGEVSVLGKAHETLQCFSTQINQKWHKFVSFIMRALLVHPLSNNNRMILFLNAGVNLLSLKTATLKVMQCGYRNLGIWIIIQVIVRGFIWIYLCASMCMELLHQITYLSVANVNVVPQFLISATQSLCPNSNTSFPFICQM